MTKVANKQVIRRLAFRELKANRRMNFVVILSIVLTCILFTALTSVGGSLINGTQQENMRQAGTDRMAGMDLMLPEDYEKVKNDSATQDVVYQIVVGSAVNTELEGIYAELRCAGDENAARAAFSDPTAGRLPESRDEIALNTTVLDKLGLPHEIGTTVPITLDTDGNISKHEFRLCGYWQGDNVSNVQECWVSRAFADEFAPTPANSFYTQDNPKSTGYWLVEFNFSNSWDIEGKTAGLLSRLYGDPDNMPYFIINRAYTTSSVDSGTVVAGIVLLLLIFAAGYLIIYNVFHINISANIRSYGLLKTIGTTSKQIKHMVRVQATVYSAIGIPLGLFIGIMLSRLMKESIIQLLHISSAESFSVSGKLMVMICLISAVFTFATVMISCRKPCRIAGSVSPIEALRYNETDIHTNKTDKKTGRITPFAVARNNMSRSKKKTVIVVLSLTLSMVLVNTLFTLLRGIDMNKFVSEQMVGDIVVMSERDSAYNGDENARITPEQIGYMNSIDGVESVCPVYFQSGELSFRGDQLDRLNDFCDRYADKDEHGEIANAKRSGNVLADIYGVTDDLLEVLEPTRGEIDPAKWQSGKYAVVNTYYLDAEDEEGEPLYSVGDKITLTSKDKTDRITKEYEVIALCKMPYALSKQSYYIFGAQVMIPDSEYFSLTENRNAMTVMVNAEENRLDYVDQQIRSMTGSSSPKLTVKSGDTYREEFRDLVRMVKLIGGTLSGVLALIGILNFVNAVVTGIISRKRELAMMNAVGMTGGQLKKMLMWEGVHYAVLTGVCSIVLGLLLDNVIVKNITEDLFFFTHHFTFVPILICVPILLLLSAVIPSAAYRSICHESVVERLRDN